MRNTINRKILLRVRLGVERLTNIETKQREEALTKATAIPCCCAAIKDIIPVNVIQVNYFLANLPQPTVRYTKKEDELVSFSFALFEASLQTDVKGKLYRNWKDFTSFGERAMDFQEMLSDIEPHIHLFRRDAAFHLYSSLILLK